MNGLADAAAEMRYKDWQRDIIDWRGNKSPSKIEEQQKQLAEAAADGIATLAGLMADVLDTDTAAMRAAAPQLPAPLTDREMEQLPIHAEQRIAAALAGVARVDAARPCFWFACHAAWIADGMFGDPETVFFGKASAPDSRTRNFLRRTGGLECVRGKISVLTDCPISAAWWRSKIAADAAAASEGAITAAAAHQLLRDRDIGTAVAQASVRRVTSLNDPRARAALLAAAEQSGGMTKKACAAAIRALGRHSHSFSLAVMPMDALIAVAADGISASQEAAADSPG